MRRDRVLHLTLVVLAAFLSLPALPRSATAGQVSGNSYTSPTYGFSITWDDSWTLAQVLADPATGEEGVVLIGADGLAIVSARYGFGGDPERCAREFGPAIAASQGFGDAQLDEFQSWMTELGQPATRATATWSFTTEQASGAGIPSVAFVECRRLADGAVLSFVHASPADTARAARPARDALLTNLVQPDLPEPPSPGEPAPVFVSGPWRVAVVVAQRSDEFNRLGLDGRDGRDWLVVVADVTAWAPEGDTLAADTLAVLAGEDDPEIAVDLTASATAAESVELSAPTEVGVSFEANQTQRLVFLFSIPAEAGDPILARGGARLPLGPAIAARRASIGNLPKLLGPPPLAEARVDRVGDGDTLSVTLVADGATQTVDLIGVAAPTGDDCYAAMAVNELADLIGETVWFEVEANADDDARYAWTEKRDGTRILLNRKLLERGVAELGSLDGDARFGDWLADAAREAEAAGEGIWSPCPDDAVQPEESDEAESAAAPTAADRAYLHGWAEPRSTLELSLQRYGELTANPLLGDPQWTNQMAFVFVAWALVHDGVAAMSPPARYADLHAACTAATSHLDAAAHEQAPNLDDWFSDATNSLDLSSFDLGLLQTRYAEAEPLLTACFAELDAASAEAGV